MPNKILVILGHPNKDSLNGALADAYVSGAEGSSADVRRINLCDLEFDPNLYNGFNGEQAWEPDLQKAADDIQWADHLVFVFPTWWASMPALLKGFIDRVFLPGEMFKYKKGSPLPEKLLTGKTGHLIVTMDSPGWWYRWFEGRPGYHIMKSGVLAFCGVKPVRFTRIGVVRGSDEVQRKKWIELVRKKGERLL